MDAPHEYIQLTVHLLEGIPHDEALSRAQIQWVELTEEINFPVPTRTESALIAEASLSPAFAHQISTRIAQGGFQNCCVYRRTDGGGWGYVPWKRTPAHRPVETETPPILRPCRLQIQIVAGGKTLSFETYAPYGGAYVTTPLGWNMYVHRLLRPATASGFQSTAVHMTPVDPAPRFPENLLDLVNGRMAFLPMEQRKEARRQWFRPGFAYSIATLTSEWDRAAEYVVKYVEYALYPRASRPAEMPVQLTVAECIQLLGRERLEWYRQGSMTPICVNLQYEPIDPRTGEHVPPVVFPTIDAALVAERGGQLALF